LDWLNTACTSQSASPHDTKGTKVLVFNSQPYLHGTAQPNDHNKGAASTERAVSHIYWCGTRMATMVKPPKCHAFVVHFLGHMSYDRRSSCLVWQQVKPFCWVKSHRILCACLTYGSPFLLML
jgi:hypothetical protein